MPTIFVNFHSIAFSMNVVSFHKNIVYTAKRIVLRVDAWNWKCIWVHHSEPAVYAANYRKTSLPKFDFNKVACFSEHLFLTLSWRRLLSYRNQPIDLQNKSMDCFLYDNGLRHERVQNHSRRLVLTIALIQKQPFPDVLQNKYSKKLRNIHRKTPVS